MEISWEIWKNESATLMTIQSLIISYFLLTFLLLLAPIGRTIKQRIGTLISSDDLNLHFQGKDDNKSIYGVASCHLPLVRAYKEEAIRIK